MPGGAVLSWPAIMVVLGAFAAGTGSASAAVVGPNLVLNGDAESSVGAERSQPGPAPTGPPVRIAYNTSGFPTSPGNLVSGASFDGG